MLSRQPKPGLVSWTTPASHEASRRFGWSDSLLADQVYALVRLLLGLGIFTFSVVDFVLDSPRAVSKLWYLSYCEFRARRSALHAAQRAMFSLQGACMLHHCTCCRQASSASCSFLGHSSQAATLKSNRKWVQDTHRPAAIPSCKMAPRRPSSMMLCTLQGGRVWLPSSSAARAASEQRVKSAKWRPTCSRRARARPHGLCVPSPQSLKHKDTIPCCGSLLGAATSTSHGCTALSCACLGLPWALAG